MTDRFWWPRRRKHPARGHPPHPAPGPGTDERTGPGPRDEPGNPPPGHTERLTCYLGCVEQTRDSDGRITAQWSCMRDHFPTSRPM